MKFAKELEDDLVPEWRAKYLNYKGGKKKIKAVSRAFRNLNRTPKTPGPPQLPAEDSHAGLPFTHYDFSDRRRSSTAVSTGAGPNGATSANNPNGKPVPIRRESVTMFATSPPVPTPDSRRDARDDGNDQTPERTPLRRAQSDGRTGSYGSIVDATPDVTPTRMDSLELPDPALSPIRSKSARPPTGRESITPILPPSVQQVEPSPDPYHVGQSNVPPKMGSSLPRRLFRSVSGRSKQPASALKKSNMVTKSKLRSMFTSHQLESPHLDDVQLEAYKELDNRQDEFFNFLDKELQKIEDFYKSKEDEADHRLQLLRQQLHELRDRRLEDVQKAKRGEDVEGDEGGLLDGVLPVTAFPSMPRKENVHPNGHGASLLRPVENVLRGEHKVGKVTKSMQELSSPPGPHGKHRNEDKSDYTRRKHDNEHVPYRFAKRRLKLALQEFYRGLELLKSYALLNRTGFRKINKKYDKAVNARPTGRYMAEKVSQAHFVTSDVIDGHLVAVEDLYTRYFERGNHKIAVGKLRSKMRAGDQSSTTFRNGLYVAAGTCFGIAGLVTASHRLYDPDPALAQQTAYLLQMYAGYFLALLLFLIFVLDCKIWTSNRINYAFVFEYDTHTTLDWRQLAEMPCFFLFLNGLFLFLNFQQDSRDSFYRFWPVILISITLAIMVMPFKILYYQSRRWWGYSNWRLLLAGLYPVEFRDFYLGDMYCSATYTMGQVELFFCLYVNDWNDPTHCTSSHSRLLGFFSALPAVWRALQCLRRYYDSRNWFPHLANFAKYGCNILYYMTLSMYRINMSNHLKAAFTAFALINGLYCSFWDVFMDFSLGNPYAKHPFLRDQLAFKRVWVYYVAIFGDVILRQQWIFYVIFSHDLQHSAAMSFFVALAEVFRRGMWSIFRVENEHCNNVGRFRASRDIPLPYEIPDFSEAAKATAEEPQTPAQASLTATGADLERQTSTGGTTASMRQRRTPHSTPGIRALQRVGTVIAAAHAQDFEKKRRPDAVGQKDDAMHGVDSSEDEDEEDDADEAEQELRERNGEDIEEASTMVDRAKGLPGI